MRSNHWKTMPRTILRDTAQSMQRNSLMSIAAVFSIIAALIILGIFLVLTINIRQATANVEPASFIIQVKDSESMDDVKAFALTYQDKGVEYVKYGEEYINALLNFNHFANTMSIVVLIVLSVISLFLIYNTIKLTVFARRKEIGIMKYVGATDAYIRTPFVLEGTFLGLIAAVVAVMIVRLAYYYILGMLGGSVLLPMTSALATPDQVMGQLIFFFTVYGVVIGAVGSVFAIRKFLDV